MPEPIRDSREPRRARRLSPFTCLVAALVATGLFLLLLAGGLLLTMGSPGPSFRPRKARGEQHWLHVRLTGELPDSPAQGGGFLAPQGAPLTLAQLARAIRDAAEDDEIEGAFVELGGSSAGWGRLRELREALLNFKAARKPLVAWGAGYDTRDYYLASACDRIAIAPGGVCLVNGFDASVTYFAGAFEKIGLVPEFEHVGDFKSAVEVYERRGPSPAASQAMDALLDSIWSTVLAETADARGFALPKLQALVDHPPLDPTAAKSAGLVDAVAFRDSVLAGLEDVQAAGWAARVESESPTEAERKEPTLIAMRDYARGFGEAAGGKSIALVYADGEIVDGENGGLFGGAQISPGRYTQLLEQVRQDDSIGAMVLRVNSPGGSGLASDLIWHEIERVQAEGKPVVVSMGDYAASGGYYIACGADWVIAQPTTITGSIGVFGGKFNLAGTFDKLGLSTFTYRRGQMSDLFGPTAPLDSERREVFRSFLEGFYERFVTRVAEGRHLSPEDVRAIAQGRVWTGSQALERKLVDGLGGVEEALAKAAELAHLKHPSVVELPRAKGFLEVLIEQLDEQSQQQRAALKLESLLPQPELRAALREAWVLEAALAGGIAAYAAGLPR